MELSRRTFLLFSAAVGGALVVGLRPNWSRSLEIYDWVVIAPDNTVTVRVAQVEMGQGGLTSMAQLLAEELKADWSQVRTEFVSIARHLAQKKLYGRTETAASSGIRLAERQLRTAGAQIRTMLIKAAAKRLGVTEHDLVAENGVITDVRTSQKLTFGEVAADASKIAVPDPDFVKLKDPKDWKFIGKSLGRLDIPLKVDGTAIFGIDVKLPKMKYAAIAISPVFGGKLKSYDDRAVLTLPGVRKVVEIKGATPDLLAVSMTPAWTMRSRWWRMTGGPLGVRSRPCRKIGRTALGQRSIATSY